MPTQPVVAVYTRISNDPEGTRAGVERQREDCMKLVADRGWRQAGIYEDDDPGASRHSNKERPEFDRMVHHRVAITIGCLTQAVGITGLGAGSAFHADSAFPAPTFAPASTTRTGGNFAMIGA